MLTFLGLVVVVSPLLLTIVLGVSSLLDRKLTEETTTQAGLRGDRLRPAGGRRRPRADARPGDAARRDRAGRLGRHPAATTTSRSSSSSTGSRCRSRSCRSSCRGRSAPSPAGTCTASAGFNRFFVLYAIFVLGMVVTSLAGTIETLFAGWELVGLSSALLVAFFQERPAPARNGLWVWVVYRVSDAALLLAAVVMHHLRGEGDFDKLLGTGPWPDEHSVVTVGPGARRGAAAAGGRGGEVGAGAVLRLAAAGDGRADAVERRVLRGPVGPPGGLPAAAGQPAPGPLGLALRRRSSRWG